LSEAKPLFSPVFDYKYSSIRPAWESSSSVVMSCNIR